MSGGPRLQGSAPEFGRFPGAAGTGALITAPCRGRAVYVHVILMIVALTERTQVLLTPEQRGRVERLAARTSRSVGAVIRDAIDAYVPPPAVADRRRALEELFALEAPVADWPELERQIEEGYGA